MLKNAIKIANGQGFWGDSSQAPIDLVNSCEIDYLTMDYLAEVTLSIMQKQKNKNPKAGYAKDFIGFLKESLFQIKSKGIKVITNAGGVNPEECKKSILELSEQLNVDIKVAVISGDDILGKLGEFLKKGVSFENLDNGLNINEVIKDVCSANVYIDSFNISEALDLGADIVLTGRVSDPGLVLGPCIYEFGWKRDDYDLLASGTVAGHIIECGAQCTGGNFSGWESVKDLENIGYPIVEITSNGEFIVKKDEKFGGLINKYTVSEQILYELGDPENYISPDVVVDFTTIKIKDLGGNKVLVDGVKGKIPTDTFKVSINYLKAYKAVGQLTVSGPNSIEKARLISELVWGRLSKRGNVYDKKNVEFIGYDSCHKNIGMLSDEPSEVVVRLSVMDKDKEKVNRFGQELAPLITNGPPGVTGFSGGRPKAQEVIAYWPTLINKKLINTKVNIF
ncbi:MAG: ATPase [Candidatus Marinimicrobia bacterium]|nr:ATPase [Candidatus Neomarinimicrobiota bacterium]|tara:strand:- start:255 stop:1607 length:1353 start_codon:yes stop_codon:yes gene_type:complete